MRGETTQAVSYAEWLRRQKGQPTWGSMLEADLNLAISQAAGYGHFLMLMEHMGYEVKHGGRLSFRLLGTGNFIVPGRRDARFTEAGIRAAIDGQLEAESAGSAAFRPAHRPYTPFRPKAGLGGFLGLYAHYLYLLGKIRKQEYPPRMTPRLKQELMKFEQYRTEFRFLRMNGIETAARLDAFQHDAETKLAALAKHRTIFNVKKKKRRPLYNALAAEEALRPAKELYAGDFTGADDEFAAYMDAAALLDACGVPREQLAQEKAALYQDVADVNAGMRAAQKNIALCEAIRQRTPHMEQDIASTIQTNKREVNKGYGTRR